MKKLIVFDLDGTLAPSKSAIDNGMARLLDQLLKVVKVAVISEGGWPQFEKQVLAHLTGGEDLKNLSLLPTCGRSSFSTTAPGKSSTQKTSQHPKESRSWRR